MAPRRSTHSRGIWAPSRIDTFASVLIAAPACRLVDNRIVSAGWRWSRIQQLLKEYAGRAGLLAAVAFHSLRHSIAVHSLEEGFSLECVADLLGHTSIRSTAIYTKITSSARDEAVRLIDRGRHIIAWA